MASETVCASHTLQTFLGSRLPRLPQLMLVPKQTFKTTEPEASSAASPAAAVGILCKHGKHCCRSRSSLDRATCCCHDYQETNRSLDRKPLSPKPEPETPKPRNP